MESWQKLLLAAGGAAGLAAVLYYLLRDEQEGEAALLEGERPAEGEREAMRQGGGEPSKEEVLAILQEISSMQQVMKENMRALTKEMAQKDLTFDEIYERTKKAQPSDPLEKRGLSAEDLDRVLQNNSNDQEVMMAVQKIMAPSEPQGGEVALTARAKEVTVETIVDIHVFMLEELQKFVHDFADVQDKSKYDLKTVGIVSQAMLDSKVSSKYNLTSEDMEGAILVNKGKLVQDMKFMQTHMEMQHCMQGFLGSAM
mmetsp:Transcript_93107/g.290253  ORF Transcript_93107/g.290253 Transcript_93107/m.290253 type:complete len:256 (-) Transcript_93107:88-855(-)